MLNTLFNMLMLYLSLRTPYPYLIGLGLFGMFLAWCATFIKIKNGLLGWTLFVVMAGATVLGFLKVRDHWSPAPTLDGKTAMVKDINRNGFLMDTGERLVPAGVEMPKRRELRALTAAIMPMLDKPVKLDWNSRMNGYTMETESGEDVSEFLVKNGYAKPSESASDKLKDLADVAKRNRYGLWVEALQAKPESPFMIALKLYLVHLLLLVSAGLGGGYVIYLFMRYAHAKDQI